MYLWTVSGIKTLLLLYYYYNYYYYFEDVCQFNIW